MDCDEWFTWDEETTVATLRRLVALCPTCHLAKHFGRAQQLGYEEQVLDHILRVNRWSKDQLEEHSHEAWTTWVRRSQIAWQFDFSILGIDPTD